MIPRLTKLLFSNSKVWFSLLKYIYLNSSKYLSAKSPGVNMSTEHMESAVNIALKGLNRLEGGPFGCVIVKDGKIVGQGNNKVRMQDKKQM